jgi:hypothetical protein
MLGQLSFHSNLNERAFSKLKSEFQKKKRRKQIKKNDLDPGEPNRPREENQPAAHSAS